MEGTRGKILTKGGLSGLSAKFTRRWGLKSLSVDDTADLFQNAQIVNVADAGHWTYHDQLEEVVTTIQEFLR